MDGPREQLEAVVELAGRLSIDVRQEQLGGDGGGLCLLRGQRVLFLDLDADEATRLARSIEALAGLDEGEDVFIPPVLRERFDLLRRQ